MSLGVVRIDLARWAVRRTYAVSAEYLDKGFIQKMTLVHELNAIVSLSSSVNLLFLYGII